MSSTNKTTHYELSQYVAADKPTYLVDYNADMSAIDTAIYNADSLAQTNETAIGNLTLLDTTVKTDLVSAVNEVEGEVGTLNTTVSGHTTSIASNTSAIGTLANLDTTTKTNLVSAINEVNDNVLKFNLTSIYNYSTSSGNVSFGSDTSNRYAELTLATNSDNSIFKLYGEVRATLSGVNTNVTVQTPLRPETDIQINEAGIKTWNNGSTIFFDIRPASILIKTTGEIVIYTGINSWDYTNCRLILDANLYFLKDFGDEPEE